MLSLDNKAMTQTEMFSLAGRVALVTGGGSGLGLGMARAFVGCGARVVILGQDEAKLIAAVAELGPAASYIQADVTSAAARDAAIASLAAREGRLDILVNNAGTHLKRDFAETSLGDFDSLLDTHVRAAFDLTRKSLPLLSKSPAASVLFIASMASYLAIPKVIGYSAAKSAVLGLVRGAAADLGPQGIRVNAIAPGWITSAMTEKALSDDPERKAKILSRTPLGRMGTAEDIGAAAVFLSSDAARFITGQILAVDGGAVQGF